jgi:hypothetical protein
VVERVAVLAVELLELVPRGFLVGTQRGTALATCIRSLPYSTLGNDASWGLRSLQV